MTKRQELINRIRRHSKDIRLEEVDSLLMSQGFNKKSKTHITLYYKLPDHRIPLRRHPNLKLHSKAVKELDKLLEDIGFYNEEI